MGVRARRVNSSLLTQYKVKSQPIAIPIRLRLFVYLPLSENFCITTAIPIPKTAIRIQPITAFQINPECKISALATIMHTKKEDRATNVKCGIWYENITVNLTDFLFSFIPFVLNLAKELIKYRLPEFFGLLLRTLGNS